MTYFKLYQLSLSVLALAFTLCPGCGSGSGGGGSSREDRFMAVLEGGGVVTNGIPSKEVLSSKSEDVYEDGQLHDCRTETVSAVDSADYNPLLDASRESIFPGAMVRVRSEGEATVEPISVRRGAGVCTMRMWNASEDVSVEVPEVTEGNVTQAENDLLRTNSEIVAADYTFTTEQVWSEEHMWWAVSANYHYLSSKVKTAFSFSQDHTYNRLLVVLFQRYYTVSFQPPTSVSDFFAADVTPEELAKYVGPGNPACYVSSVSYGRIFYVLVESTTDLQKMSASVDASFRAALAGGSGHLEGTSMKELKNLKIQVLAVGGDSELALAAFTGEIDEIAEFLTKGGDIKTGLPVSYVLRNVLDDSLVRVGLAVQYDRTICIDISGDACSRPGTLRLDIGGGCFGDKERSGYVDIRVPDPVKFPCRLTKSIALGPEGLHDKSLGIDIEVTGWNRASLSIGPLPNGEGIRMYGTVTKARCKAGGWLTATATVCGQRGTQE